MNQSIPKCHETFIPLLDVLSNNKLIYYDKLRKRVRDKHYSHLSDDMLKLETKSGDVLMLNRIGWVKAYCKEGKYIEQPTPGQVKITQKVHLALKHGSIALKMLNGIQIM